MMTIRRWLTTLMTLCLAFTALPALAASDDDLNDFRDKLTDQWVLVKQDRLRNIKTWIKQEDGKRFRSFKVEATLTGTVETYTRVMLDADNFNKWYWEVMESKMLKRPSPTEYYMYLKHRAPYGQPNRDVVLHAKLEPQTAQNRTLTINIQAAPDFIPEKPGLVRMLAEDMVVRVSPLIGNRILVEAEGYVDPGGNVPNWAINYIQRSAPYSILLGLQRMMENRDYWANNSHLPFPILSAAY